MGTSEDKPAPLYCATPGQTSSQAGLVELHSPPCQLLHLGQDKPITETLPAPILSLRSLPLFKKKVIYLVENHFLESLKKDRFDMGL